MIAEHHNERLLFATSTHWMKYMTKGLRFHLFLVIGVILLFVSVPVAKFSGDIALVIFFSASILIGLAHHLFFHLLMSEEMMDIFVTNERVIYFNDCLFVCDDEHEIPLEKIAAVETQQRGFVQNVLDYGILWFDTGGGSVDIRRSIPHVPHPEKMANIINMAIKHRE